MTTIRTEVLSAPPAGPAPVGGAGPASAVAAAAPPVASTLLRLSPSAARGDGHGDGQDDGQPRSCVLTRVDYAPEGTGHRLLRTVLGPSERRHVDGMRLPRRRQEYVMARYSAKVATRTAMGQPVPFHSIDTVGGVFHQPLLTFPGNPGLEVSLTHTGGTALALVHPRACPLGIDLERVAPDTVAAARRYLTPEERALLRDSAASTGGTGTPEQLTLVLWTAKEALSKALRTGLTIPFDVLCVDRLSWRDGGWSVGFRRFPHFRARAEFLGDRVVALAHPAPALLASIGVPEAGR